LHQAYLRIQLGIKALNDAHYNEATEQFTVAINSGVLSNEGLDHSQYEIFVIVRSYYSSKNAFHAQLLVCAALRVGPRLLMASCIPESVPRIPSGG